MRGQEDERQSATPSCNESLLSLETMARREEMCAREKNRELCADLVFFPFFSSFLSLFLLFILCNEVLFFL